MGSTAAGTDEWRAEVGDDLVAFCRREHPRLVGSVGLYLNDARTAEDIAQEVLLRVCGDWSRVRTLESPGGWAHRVAMNLAVSAARSRRTRRRIEATMPPVSECVQRDSDPIASLAMRAALAALPERQREALVLRYYADMSVAEVAETMACPEGTVKTLTSRGIAALRALGWEVEE